MLLLHASHVFFCFFGNFATRMRPDFPVSHLFQFCSQPVVKVQQHAPHLTGSYALPSSSVQAGAAMQSWPETLHRPFWHFLLLRPACSIHFFFVKIGFYKCHIHHHFCISASEPNVISRSSAAISLLQTRIRLSSASSFDSRFMLPYQTIFRSITA